MVPQYQVPVLTKNSTIRLIEIRITTISNPYDNIVIAPAAIAGALLLFIIIIRKYYLTS